jgi:L-alanine-DL-glutamate epimerase-like enolase superfamily enzyme
MPNLSVSCESWPLARTFTISRGSTTVANTVTATVAGNGKRGRGECVPYARYGESVEGVAASIRDLAADIAAGMDRQALQRVLPAGAARNALDCALWDLEAKAADKPVWELAGLAEPHPLTTAFTIGLDNPEAMGRAARAEAHRPLLKIKLTGGSDLERIAAVRVAAPRSRLIVDANESWTAGMVEPLSAALAELGVEAIEQPLAADSDQPLADLPHLLPFYADESCHDRASLPAIIGKYDGINIKLDKTGGLTEALALKKEAQSVGLKIMVGCMVSTSLSMAPAALLAQDAAIVDLDGALLLARDREHGLRFSNGELFPPCVALWG